MKTNRLQIRPRGCSGDVGLIRPALDYRVQPHDTRRRSLRVKKDFVEYLRANAELKALATS